jgi:uncharacterized protein YukE
MGMIGLAKPAMAVYLAGLLGIGVWGLYQSHQLGRAEMARDMAKVQRDNWQAEAEKLEVLLSTYRVAIDHCQRAVEQMRQEAQNRALAAAEARARAETLAKERDAAVARWRGLQGVSCQDAMPMVNEALGL